MKFTPRLFLAGTALAGLLGLAGCEVDAYPGDGYYAEPYPAAYDTYYFGGYYDGPYWYWRDRDGHLYHEMREYHERREHEFRDRGGYGGRYGGNYHSAYRSENRAIGPRGGVGREAAGRAGGEGHEDGGHR